MLEVLWFCFNGLCAVLADAARLESVALHKMIIITNYYYLRQGYVFTGVSWLVYCVSLFVSRITIKL